MIVYSEFENFISELNYIVYHLGKANAMAMLLRQKMLGYAAKAECLCSQKISVRKFQTLPS
jgi:hypothetical protein